jgi:hypothetical protein
MLTERIAQVEHPGFAVRAVSRNRAVNDVYFEDDSWTYAASWSMRV